MSRIWVFIYVFAGFWVIYGLVDFLYMWFKNGQFDFDALLLFVAMALLIYTYSLDRKERKKSYQKLSSSNIKRNMLDNDFDVNVMTDLLAVLENRKKRLGDVEFNKWLSNLNFAIPDEFEDEKYSKKFYEKHSIWIESQVKQLEKEINMTWKEMTEDLTGVDDNVKKTQLVVRQRLTEIVLDLTD